MAGLIHPMQIRCVAAHLYPVVKQAGSDNESSSTYNTEAENRWRYTPQVTYASKAWCLTTPTNTCTCYMNTA
jgi:hypothetical protein